MTDLHQTNSRVNSYFQDPRIRRFLIRAGLINRHGDILRSSSHEVSLAPPSKGRRTKEHLSRSNDTNVAEEEERPGAIIRKQVNFSVKGAHKLKQPHRSVSRSLSNIGGSPLSTNEKRSPKRAKSAHHSSHDFGKHFVRRSAKVTPPIKQCCRVIMTYYGPQMIIDYDKSWFQQEGDEILVMQQHCGGENLTVFKGYVKPKETFAFDSKRHPDYPFALALYINGLIDSRISVCCEYKHKKNVTLGGPHGLFCITDVQKVKPCRSCKYQRRKKKSKSTASLALESSRYRRSIVPRVSSRTSSRSPVPRPKSNSPPVPSTNRGPSPDLPATPTSEEDDKVPPLSTNRRDSSVVPTGHYSNTQSSAASRTSQRSPEDDDKKPPISSARRKSPVVRADHKSNIQSPSPSTSEEDDKKPKISSAKRSSPIVPTGYNSNSQSPDVSRTPTPSPPPSEAEEKKPPISSTRRYSPVVPTGYTSNIQNPVTSQNDDDDDDDENYSTDFDEPHDGDDPSMNSRFGRPRISDTHSIDRDQGGSNKQPRYSFSNLSSSGRSDDSDNQQSSKILTETKNTIDHSRKSSSSTLRKSGPEDEDKNQLFQVLLGKNNVAGGSRRSSSSTSRKSGPSKDENDHYTPRILNGRNNVADDSDSSSSRKSGPSPSDKIKRELNENNTHNRFSSTTISKKDIGGDRESLLSSDDHTSAKKNEDIHYPSKVRRTPSSSSEDFFGIKRSSSREKNKDIPVFSKDWFETNSRNDPDDNDQLNLYSSPRTRPKNKFFDQDD